MGLGDVKIVNVTEPAFYKQVQQRLTKTPLGTWKAYLRWQVARDASPYLSKKFADANFDFYRHYLRGVPAEQPRWKRCVQWIDRDLGEALGKVYVDKLFGPEVKKRTLDMTVEIERAMAEELKALPWMGAATKAKASEKLKSIVNKIGYPDKWRDYSRIAVKRDDFFGDVELTNEFEAKRQLAKIGKPLDRGEWQMTPPTVNAYYDPQMNDINFPAGVLQPPLFDFKLDDAPNYGNTGATIGHELIHGFDDEGRQFDARGNLTDWWSPADDKQFLERAQCVVDEYAQFVVVDDIKINSKLTLGEDLADLGGTVLAYQAWKRVTQAKTLPKADGFSPDQRFFIGMAQWACNNERDENKRLNAITNPHSPGKYRINGVVANMPEFGQAFTCKAGAPMVRKNQCRVW
jgi:endothelin-converting enzyme/putative endopeptidase